MNIQVTSREAIALKRFSYLANDYSVSLDLEVADDRTVFDIGDRVSLRQGGEAFFIWDRAGFTVLYRTESLAWLLEHLAFEFQVEKKTGQGAGTSL